MKYQVQFTEQVITTVVVEADSRLEALERARCNWRELAESVEWLEESAAVTAVSEQIIVIERPLLEVARC